MCKWFVEVIFYYLQPARVSTTVGIVGAPVARTSIVIAASTTMAGSRPIDLYTRTDITTECVKMSVHSTDIRFTRFHKTYI